MNTIKIMEETKLENFEDQLDEIDQISSDTLDVTSEEPEKPKMTRSETKSAILNAMKTKDISMSQGKQLLLTLGFTKQNNKKVINDSDRARKRKQQKKARKANRK